jgi:hypothetical protein
LQAYTGSNKPAKGTVIRLKKITTPLWLFNGNITVDRCWIQPTASLPGGLIVTYDWNSNNSTPSQYSSTITNCDIDGSVIAVSDVAYQSAMRGLATVRRCNVFGMGTGITILCGPAVDCLVEQNYVHSLRAYGNGATTGSHNESASIRGYGGLHLVFRNNRLISKTGNDSGALFIQAWAQAINHSLITGTLFESNSYGMPLEANNHGYGNDMKAVNNRFVKGGYGPAYVTGGPGWAQWTENYYDSPTSPDHKGTAIPKP